MTVNPNQGSDQPTTRPAGEVPQSPVNQSPMQQPSATPLDGETPDLDMGTEWMTESYDNLQTKSGDDVRFE